MKFKKKVSQWMAGKLTDEQFAALMTVKEVKKLEQRVFDAVERRTATAPTTRTLQ